MYRGYRTLGRIGPRGTIVTVSYHISGSGAIPKEGKPANQRNQTMSSTRDDTNTAPTNTNNNTDTNPIKQYMHTNMVEFNAWFIRVRPTW